MSTDATLLLPGQAGITPVDPDFDPEGRRQEEIERQADCPELLTFLKRTTDSIKSKDEEAWLRIINAQVRCMAYYDERQYGTVRDGRFHDARWEPGDIRPIDNRYKVQIDKLMMEMARSQTKIEISAADPNDTKMAEAAKFAQHRVETNRRRVLKNSERLREAMALLLKMMTYRYVFYNRKSKHAPKERKARKEMKEYGSTRSIVSCAACGHPMRQQPAENGNQPGYKCIDCGATEPKVIQLSSRKQEVVTGYDEVEGGCADSMHIDPMMVRIDLDARQGVADSTFLWYHQMISRCILEEAYEGMRIKGAAGTPSEIADRYKQDLQSAPSNTPSFGALDDARDVDPQGGDQLEKCPFDLFWLDPVMYRKRKFSKPQRLLGGRVLPANVELGKLFPDGMCVARNDDQILDVYGEDKNRKWLFCVYGIREHALHGAGTANLLGPQDTRNEIKAHLIANLIFNSSPREFVRDGAITGNRLPALNEVAIVNKVNNEKPLKGWAYERAEGTAMPAQAMALYESEGGAMQEGAGTSSLSNEGGAADIKALGTATGVAAMRDQAVGRMGPNLMLITEMEEEWSYLVMELELENFSEERFMRMANQAVTARETDGAITYTAEGIKAFMGCNPRVDLVAKAVPGSWMPRTEAEKKANFAAFAQFAAVIAEKLQEQPALAQRFLSAAAEAWEVDIELGGWTPTGMVAAVRIQALAETVESYTRYGRRAALPNQENVEAVLLRTPDAAVDKEMDNHILFMEFYKQWWASDEAQSCPPLLRACVKAMYVLHRQGLVYQAQEKAKDELAANEPKEQKAAEIAAAAAANGQGDDKAPSVSMSYKDAPEDVRRQIEQDAGYQPSQMGTSDDGGAGDLAKEHVKIEGQLAVNQQKADLELRNEHVKTQLAIDKEAATSQLDEDRAESDHSRNLEVARDQHQHETGMQGADHAHDSVKAASEHAHKERVTDKQVKAKQNSTDSKK